MHLPVILLYLSVRVPTLQGRWANHTLSPTTNNSFTGQAHGLHVVCGYLGAVTAGLNSCP